ncbi:hypothetical protein F2Q70_00005437 [Brassica cretica]|uniref:Uncharacterized protein n=1 Tax=Brassica cretica TaxID=69181 RepID=A0A8S9IX97_BRACR|nr:hypothetical protein F2Q70_00005437 [Brassica cretica]
MMDEFRSNNIRDRDVQGTAMTIINAGERRGERRSVCSVCLVSLETSLENSPSSSPRRAIVSLSVVPRRKAILPLRGSSLSVDRRRNDNSLSLRGSSRKQRRSYLSLGCCRRGRKSLIISLTVGILDGEEPLSLSLSLSLCGSTGIGRFDYFSWWLSSTAIYGSLSMALLNGDGALCRWLSAIRSGKASVSCSSIMDVSDCALISCDLDKQAFDMFGGKRAQGGSSIKG